MLPVSLVASFDVAAAHDVLAQLSPLLGGASIPLPIPRVEGSGPCGRWAWEHEGTKLTSEVAYEDPRGSAFVHRHRLELPDGSFVKAQNATLSDVVTELPLELHGIDLTRFEPVRSALAERFGDAERSTDAYSGRRIAQTLLDAGHEDLARAHLERTVRRAVAEALPPPATRDLFTFARTLGVDAPKPLSEEDEPLPPFSEAIAMVLALQGERGIARVKRYLAQGLDEAQKKSLFTHATKANAAPLVQLLLQEAELSWEALASGAHDAARAGNATLLSAYLAEGVAQHLDVHGLLLFAAANHPPSVLPALVEAVGDVDYVSSTPNSTNTNDYWVGVRFDGFTPLLSALHGRKPDNVAALVALGANVNRLTLAYRMPLDVAHALRDAKSVATLTAAGARRRTRDDLDLAGALFVDDLALAEERLATADLDARARALEVALQRGLVAWIDRLAPDAGGALFVRAAELGSRASIVHLRPRASDAEILLAARRAAEANRVDALRAMHELGLAIFGADEDGLTALHDAALHDAVDAAEFLVAYGADPEATDAEGRTPRSLVAGRRVSPRLSKALSGARPRPPAPRATTTLPEGVSAVRRSFEAALGASLHEHWRRRLPAIDRLAPPLAELERCSPLTRALQAPLRSGGEVEAALALVAKSDVNALDEHGASPLNVAIVCNPNAELVAALLERGADPNAIDGTGTSPLEAFVASYGRLELVSALKRKKLDAKRRFDEERTAVHLAVLRGVPDAVRALKKLGTSLDASDVFGWAPLHLTPFDDRHAGWQSLLKAGADPNVQTPDGETALTLATRLAMHRRVEHAHWDGNEGKISIAYTIEAGVLRFEKNGKPRKLKPFAEQQIALDRFRPHYDFLRSLDVVIGLVAKADLSAVAPDGEPVLQKLADLAHPRLEAAVTKRGERLPPPRPFVRPEPPRVPG